LFIDSGLSRDSKSEKVAVPRFLVNNCLSGAGMQIKINSMKNKLLLVSIISLFFLIIDSCKKDEQSPKTGTVSCLAIVSDLSDVTAPSTGVAGTWSFNGLSKASFTQVNQSTIFTDVTPGTYDISLVASTGQKFTSPFSVEAGKTTSITLMLAKINGSLSNSSSWLITKK
jgi:hypothetical protein